MALRRSTLVGVVSWTIACSAVAGSCAYEKAASGRLVALVEKCRADVSPGSAFKPICEPWELQGNAGLRGIQSEIVSLRKDVTQRSDVFIYSVLFGAALAIVGMTPVVWYFILARLREVAGAIRGDGPK